MYILLYYIGIFIRFILFIWRIVLKRVCIMHMQFMLLHTSSSSAALPTYATAAGSPHVRNTELDGTQRRTRSCGSVLVTQKHVVNIRRDTASRNARPDPHTNQPFLRALAHKSEKTQSSGERGIRTLETVTRLRDFQSRSFGRSDISPAKGGL